jgi:hypothetical protein
MESLLKLVDPQITSLVQGYLSAEFEDIFARPHTPSLVNGKEEVIWKKATTSTIKGFDEIQRLGVGALTGMFRLMSRGTVIYLDQEKGEKQSSIIASKSH